MKKQTKRERARALMDATLRDLFTNGGPMRGVKATIDELIEIDRRERARLVPHKCPALLAEQRRLIKTWGVS